MIEVTKARTSLEVRFDFDKAVIGKVKQVDGYEWDKKAQCWRFPLDVESVVGLREQFPDALRLDESAFDWLNAAMVRRERILDSRMSQEPLLYERVNLLHEYQRTMVRFMVATRRALNTDRMGLGKTVEAIAAISEMVARGDIPDTPSVLIVCPNSMKYTWWREWETWYIGPDLDGIQVIGKEQPISNQMSGVWIINWEKLLRREHMLTKKYWDVIIGDESHRMKNRDAKQTQSMHKLDAPVKFLLTGTPIKNHVPDLWSQLKWLDKGRFPSYWKFWDRFVLSQDNFWGGKEMIGTKNEDQLRAVLATIQMGRTVDEVDLELPPLRHVIERVELGERQRKAYDQMRDEFVAMIEAEEGDPDTVIKAKNWMVQALRLKQIAGSLGIFSDEHDDSIKLDRLFELMDETEDEKWVQMSQFRTMVMQLHERLKQRETPHIILTGKGMGSWEPKGGYVEYKTRDDGVMAFQTEEKWQAFIATTQTGGEGITLTSARYFAFLDLLWTPADNDQAWSRIHRKGQTRSCFIYSLLADDTIDFSGIVPKLRSKRAIIDAVLGPREDPPIGTD